MASSKEGPVDPPIDPSVDAGASDPVGGDPQDVRKSPTAMTPAERAEALARQKVLGRQLKPLWDDVTKEPLPADFLSLLDDMSPEDGAAP